jgi:hypothetical protein
MFKCIRREKQSRMPEGITRVHGILNLDSKIIVYLGTVSNRKSNMTVD